MYLRTHWKRMTIYGLLLVHTLWVTQHLYLATQDAVNPWKMGGYGMYVEPKRGVYIDVERVDENGEISGDRITSIDTYELYRWNWNFNFYCKPVTEKSLVRFIEDNEQLQLVDHKIELFAYRFAANPLRTDPYLIGTVDVSWLSGDRLAYEVRMCGENIDRAGELRVEL